MSRSIRVVASLLLAALVPSIAAAQSGSIPRLLGDTVDRRPEPSGLPCTIVCTRIQHEVWRQFDSRIDVGLGGGAVRVATGSVGMLMLPTANAAAAWTRAFHDWSLGSSARGWVMPRTQGASGWGGNAMLRAAVPLFSSETELHVGAGVGVERIAYGRTLPTLTTEHWGVAYEAGLSHEFLGETQRGLLLSGGVVGLQADGGYPNTSGPMFVAGLGLRWHRWTATQHESQGRYPRRGPRWPRPTP